ncbi:MAG: hypothetical protein IJD28_00285 [Deferribacterales bacterium]|nr:hypothetical protein [Deferribacterales bacterium]
MAKTGKKQLLYELEELAAKVGIKVRYERTDARGGMCLYKGSQLIIIDRNATDDYKISVIIDNLRKIDLTDQYLTPKLRDVLDNY